MIKLKDVQYATLLDTQKSDSTDELYEIRWNKEDNYSCTCMGYRKNRPCKHIKRFWFKSHLDIKGIENIEYILDIAKYVWKGKV